MRMPFPLLFVLLATLPASRAAATPRAAPVQALWAAIDDHFAQAEDHAVRAALPAPFSVDRLLLTPETVSQPNPDASAKFPARLDELLQAAWLSIHDRDFEAASQTLGRIVNTKPRSEIGATAAYLKAAAEVALYRARDEQRPQSAIDALTLAVTLHPEEPDATRALFTLAEVYRHHDAWDEALAYYHRAAGIAGDSELRSYVRYREMMALAHHGDWVEAYRIAKEIIATAPDHPCADLARFIYLDNAIATGDATGILREYDTLVAAGDLRLEDFPTYRYEALRALFTEGEVDRAHPLLDPLRSELAGEAPASLLLQAGDAELHHGRDAEALTFYEKIGVQYGRTAMADLARLREIQIRYPTTPRLDRLRLLGPLRNLAKEVGRPQLRTLARNLRLAMYADNARWDEVMARLDARPRVELDLRAQPWFEPLYGYTFSKLWLDRVVPRDLLEVYFTFREGHHDTATLTPAFRRHLAHALVTEGYLEGALVLLADLATADDADIDTRLTYLETLARAYSAELAPAWRRLRSEIDIDTLPPRSRLRYATLGLRLGETRDSPLWAASALAEDDTLAAADPEATYRLATYLHSAGHAAEASALLAKIYPLPVPATPPLEPWRVAATLAACLHDQGESGRAAVVLREALHDTPPTVAAERSWAEHFIALTEGQPAGAQDPAPSPFWQRYQAVQDRYLQWQIDNRAPLQRLRAEIAVTGTWAEAE